MQALSSSQSVKQQQACGDVLIARRIGQTVPISGYVGGSKTYVAVDPVGETLGMTQRETIRTKHTQPGTRRVSQKRVAVAVAGMGL